jgi:5-methylcytosine-specific restriction protein A
VAKRVRLPSLRPTIAIAELRTAVPPPKRADPELLTQDHRRFRAIVLARAGFRCEWVENGMRCMRCEPADRLIADHRIERADGGALFDPANGQCLCVPHNTRKASLARTRRLSALAGADSPAPRRAPG